MTDLHLLTLRSELAPTPRLICCDCGSDACGEVEVEGEALCLACHRKALQADALEDAFEDYLDRVIDDPASANLVVYFEVGSRGEIDTIDEAIEVMREMLGR